MKIKISGTPNATFLIHAQPDDFRAIADKLDFALSNMVSGRSHCTLEIGDGFTVVSAKENKVEKFIPPVGAVQISEDCYLQTR
jgi:hypothetical protein